MLRAAHGVADAPALNRVVDFSVVLRNIRLPVGGRGALLQISVWCWLLHVLPRSSDGGAVTRQARGRTHD